MGDSEYLTYFPRLWNGKNRNVMDDSGNITCFSSNIMGDSRNMTYFSSLWGGKIVT